MVTPDLTRLAALLEIVADLSERITWTTPQDRPDLADALNDVHEFAVAAAERIAGHTTTTTETMR